MKVQVILKVLKGNSDWVLLINSFLYLIGLFLYNWINK